jgi:hypothetical protein
MSPTLARILAPGVLAARIVWFALLSAIPIYVVVARFVAPGTSWEALPAPALMATFATLAIGLAIASVLLPRVYPSDGLLARLVDQEQTPETIAAALAPAAVNVELLRELDAIERRLVIVVPVFRVQATLRGALAEGIAVLGFALAILSGGFLYVTPFAGLALVLMLLAYPRVEPLVERARRQIRI